MLLHLRSCFSLRYGVLPLETLISGLQQLGWPVALLADLHNTSMAMGYYHKLSALGLKPLLGISFHFPEQAPVLALACNAEGFRLLNETLSAYNRQPHQIPDLLALPSDHLRLVFPFGSIAAADLPLHAYIGVRHWELNRFALSPDRLYSQRCVALHHVTFQDKRGFNAHRLLRAIDGNVLLSQLETSAHAHPGETWISPEQAETLYAAFPELLLHARQLIAQIDLRFSEGNKNKKSFLRSEKEDLALLRGLAHQGMQERYGDEHPEAYKRINKELKVIAQLKYAAYFLISWDIIRYAREQNIPYVGRGSGANSIVAYCLRITDVDPITLDLYFERFLNPYRSSPPDFDLDFEHYDREKITAYIFKRYGETHTALLATYNSFQGRSVIRELGKVFGLPKAEIDALVQGRKRKLKPEYDQISQWIFTYAKEIEGLPNHLSIHAGGILISEEPITTYSALDLPPKGYPLVHLDMYDAEALGWHKYDILGQRGLGHIRDAVNIILRNRGEQVDPDPQKAMQDPNVAEALAIGDTIGCFYIESPAMRMLLRKLHCRDYLTLVAASSIIRPGVSRSGMMQQYIRRFHKPEEVQYLHPKMQELLSETYGVMVFQEDVIKVAHHFGGLDMAKADVLRRAMSGKYRGSAGFDMIREEFFESCRQQGHEEKISAEVWRQIESFAGYSFSKAHSASFAVESYQSLYLKVYYPQEFYTAVLNNEGGFYSRDFYLQQARAYGVNIHPPCLNHSHELDHLVGSDLYVGFRYVKDLEHKLVKIMLKERTLNGPFNDLHGLIKRVRLSLPQVQLLIRSGALGFTGKSKQVLLLEAYRLLADARQQPAMPVLFEPELKSFALPPLKTFVREDAYDEIELFDMPLCFPFDLLDSSLIAAHTAADLPQHKGQAVSVSGYFIAWKPAYTIKNEGMGFGHFMDVQGKTFDTTHFPKSFAAFPFQGKGFYRIEGKVDEEFGQYSIVVERMEKLPMLKKELRHE